MTRHTHITETVLGKQQIASVNHAVVSVLQECRDQLEKWGVQDHSKFKWVAILVEEVGEFSQASLEANNEIESQDDYRKRIEKCRAEAVQVAAVALQIIATLDRTTLNIIPKQEL